MVLMLLVVLSISLQEKAMQLIKELSTFPQEHGGNIIMI